MDTKVQQRFVEQAYQLALKAQQLDEVPIGAIIVDAEGRCIGKGHNRTRMDNDPSAHAEIVAIRQACQTVSNFRLNGATLYVTLEPCVMCAGAILQARIAHLVFSCRDQRFGAAGSALNLLESPFMNHRTTITKSGLEAENEKLLKDFFKAKRRRKDHGSCPCANIHD